MPKYDSIIFDLDGTLWDAAEASATGWNAAFERLGMSGYQVSANDIRSISGRPFVLGLEAVLAGKPITPEILLAVDAEERRSVEAQGGTPYIGVMAGAELLAAHYRLFLISNCQRWYLESFWNHTGLRRYFADYDCNGLSSLLKPEMIDRMIREHGLARTIYVGDTEWDEEASASSRIDFGYAAYGFGRAHNPTATFPSFQELVDWFSR